MSKHLLIRKENREERAVVVIIYSNLIRRHCCEMFIFCWRYLWLGILCWESGKQVLQLDMEVLAWWSANFENE